MALFFWFLANKNSIKKRIIFIAFAALATLRTLNYNIKYVHIYEKEEEDDDKSRQTQCKRLMKCGR